MIVVFNVEPVAIDVIRLYTAIAAIFGVVGQ